MCPSDRPSLPATPISKDLVSLSPGATQEIQLRGSRCLQCGESALGAGTTCINCGSEAVEPIAFSPDGILWTYTVVRHKPPGDYRGAEPFVPFGLGLVELAEGLRVLAPLEGDIAELQIGNKYRLRPLRLRGDGDGDLMGFAFARIR